MRETIHNLLNHGLGHTDISESIHLIFLFLLTSVFVFLAVAVVRNDPVAPGLRPNTKYWNYNLCIASKAVSF